MSSANCWLCVRMVSVFMHSCLLELLCYLVSDSMLLTNVSAQKSAFMRCVTIIFTHTCIPMTCVQMVCVAGK